MQTALHLTTWVQPGGRIEIVDVLLPAGNLVDLFVLLPSVDNTVRPSIVDVLADAPGHLAFHSADEADAYIREERDAWER